MLLLLLLLLRLLLLLLLLQMWLLLFKVFKSSHTSNFCAAGGCKNKNPAALNPRLPRLLPAEGCYACPHKTTPSILHIYSTLHGVIAFLSQ